MKTAIAASAAAAIVSQYHPALALFRYDESVVEGLFDECVIALFLQSLALVHRQVFFSLF